MFKNILWELIGKFGAQIVTFFLSVVLARVLSPSEFGVMGIALVVIQISSVFMDLGFRTALIQRQEVNEVQYSSVFFLNAVIALILAICCFASADLVASFYQKPHIGDIFRVLSLNFLLAGMALVPGARLFRELKFRENSLVNIVSAISSGIIGVAMAYGGFGVWALVWQTLSNSFFVLIGCFIAARWLPVMAFSMKQVRPLFQYGSRLFASSLIDIIFVRIDVLIIGKLFSSSQLGYYTRAQSFDGIVKQFSAGNIIGALFPYISRNQHDKNLVRQLYDRYLHLIMFVSIGISGTLFLVADELFVFLFSEKWAPAAPLYRILAIGGFVWPISALMCNVVSGMGNAAAFLRLELWKKAVFLPIYVFGFWAGLVPFIWALMAGYYVAVLLNAWFLSREIQVSVAAQLRMICAYFVAGALASLLVWYGTRLLPDLSLLPTIVTRSVLFALGYLLLLRLAKMKGLGEIQVVWNKIRKLL